uniref:Uncharacterized protein n=1 Tax=Amphilophus citrinellus TaxID=61819 RepID=A0A3Q0RXD1_AMPCI
MSEFRIHHDVNELLSLLHVRGGDGAEGYIDLLQKHRTPYVTTTVSAHSAKVGLLWLCVVFPLLSAVHCDGFSICKVTRRGRVKATGYRINPLF